MARQQPEAKLVKKIKTALETEVGGLWFKVHGGPYQQAGISDLLGCVAGKFVAIEVKMPGKEATLTKLQRHFLETVITSGGLGVMVTSPEDAVSIVITHLEHNPTV